MPASFTFATLKQKLQDFTEDTSEEFVDNLSTIIGLAESKCAKDLDITNFDAVVSGSMTASSPALTIPTTLSVVRSLWYTNADGEFVEILPRPLDFVRSFWPDPTAEGSPRYYAIKNATEYVIAPTPDDNYSYQAHGIARAAGLSDSQTTTYLSTIHGDLLFYACLLCSEGFLIADDRIPVWEKQYNDALASSRNELKTRARRADFTSEFIEPGK